MGDLKDMDQRINDIKNTTEFWYASLGGVEHRLEKEIETLRKCVSDLVMRNELLDARVKSLENLNRLKLVKE